MENKLAKLTRHVYKPGVRKAFSEFGDQLNGYILGQVGSSSLNLP